MLNQRDEAAPGDLGEPRPPERFEALDGLRGIAAVTVVTSHIMYVMSVGSWWRYTPLACSQEAVRLFFILSGFVLALPFLRGPVAPGPFWVKRFFRIWPTYMVALGLAAGLMWGFAFGDRGRLVEPWLWLDHLVLVKSFDNGVVDGVVWSLVHEMRLSLAFPLLMLLLVRAPARRVLGVALGCSLVGVAGNRLLEKAQLGNDYMLSLHYGALFLVGFLLARHREGLVAWWTGRSRTVRGLALGAAVLAYTFTAHLTDLLPPGMVRWLLNDWLVVLAASTLLVAALAPGRWQAFLRHPACAFLGTISYSLYLVHLPILKALAYRVMVGKFSQGSIAVAAIVLSFAVAIAFYRLIETPSVALGRKLAAWRPVPAIGEVTGV